MNNPRKDNPISDGADRAGAVARRAGVRQQLGGEWAVSNPGRPVSRLVGSWLGWNYEFSRMSRRGKKKIRRGERNGQLPGAIASP
ncbi:MAG TPA: hypothetical protein VGF55_00130 [Gemmataceae bacterium]|jgi:hypothetical protein